MGAGNRSRTFLIRWGVRGAVFGAMIASLAACAAGERTNDVIVVGTDYAFQLPETLPAGRTLIALENRGKVDHELTLARLKPGITMQQVLETQRSGGDPDEVVDAYAGVLFARPGQTGAGKLMIDLTPGRTYALLCFLQDADEAPPHVAMGMVGSFRVE